MKAAIYDKNFNLVDRQSRPVNYIRENGFVEFDAYVYCRDLIGLLADMVKKNHVANIRQIAFTGQAESLVVLDGEGMPLMNAISWMDERSTEECEELAKQFDAATCEAVTGQMAVLPTWPATKILWLKNNKPEIFGNAATYMMLKDFVVFKLTGKKMADMSIATFTFYFDIYEKKYWQKIIEILSSRWLLCVCTTYIPIVLHTQPLFCSVRILNTSCLAIIYSLCVLQVRTTLRIF